MANEISIVVTAKDLATKTFKSMGVAAAGLKESLFSVQGALASIGAGALAQGMINTAASFENLELSLTTITGSSAKAKAAMDWITEFTATTPYELEEVANAFKKLSAYGLEPTKYLRTLGDTAASMGKSLDMAVEAFADAATGQFERLKEFGIRATTEGNKVTFAWVKNGQQLTKTVEKTGTAITESLGQIWSERFSGGMERLSQGWSGMWSNLQDQITLFSKAVMDSGVFDYLKARLRETLETLTRMTQDGSLKEMAQEIGGNLVTGLDKLKTSLTGLVNLYLSMPKGTGEALQMGILGNLLFGPKGTVIIGGGTYLIQSLAQSVEGFKRALSGDISLFDYIFSNRQELETYLDQADRERLAKEQAKYAQMDALDAQRTENLKGKYSAATASSAASEAVYADKIKGIQNDLTLFRSTEWDKIVKDIKAKLKEAETEEQKFADKVKALQEERRLANLSTEEKIRAMLRTTMTDYQAYQDKLAQANASLASARQALAVGDATLSESWAKKAQEQFADLNAEVKDGERVLVNAASAQTVAVQGVVEAGKALDQAIAAQEKAAEESRKKFADQVAMAKDDLASIKTMQESIDNLEIELSANDNASPVLEHIQAELAQIKDKTVTVTVRYRRVGDDGRASGGYIPGFHSGGRLPGFSLTDNMLAMIRGRVPIGLAGGEFITNALATRAISKAVPGLLESLNRVRSGADLSRLLAGLSGLAGGGRVAESFRVTLAAGGRETTLTTASRAEYDGIKAMAKDLHRLKLVTGV